MKMFLIIVATILSVIIGLALVCVGSLFSEKIRRKVRIVIFSVDVVLILICVIGMTLNAKLHFPSAAVEIFGSVMVVIFTSQLICILTVIVALIIRKIYRMLNKPVPFNRERRSMLAYSLFYPIYSFVTAIYANQIERNDTIDNFYDIPIKNLPDELNNFRIAQISDIHLGAFFSLEKLESTLNRISEAKSDLLVITGDIFDSIEINDEAIKLVDSFCDKFKYGIFYCHGNHEHHRGIKPIEAGLKQTQIHWLVNDSAQVSDSSLYILGVDYPMNSPVMHSKDEREQNIFNQRKHDYLLQAIKNVPEDAICILLAHHPEFIDDAAEFNIPLTLTGHTHGSQIGFFGVPLLPFFKYTRGMFEHLGSDGKTKCYGYVHVGNGSWFPFRLGCPPEIAYFILKSDSSQG